MMTKNPYSLTFGKEPISLISRAVQVSEILDGFEKENPSYQVCMITGVRGVGKTVLLTEVSKALRSKEDWIVVDLSPERDLLQGLAAFLSNQPNLLELFRKAKINLSFLVHRFLMIQYIRVIQKSETPERHLCGFF